ncbi:hypothetical protein CsSME_00028145 [Camellia sinensis var. sinensis]
MVFWGSLSDPEEKAQDDEANQDDEAKPKEDAVQAELWFLPLLSLFPFHFTWKQFTLLLSFVGSWTNGKQFKAEDMLKEK